MPVALDRDALYYPYIHIRDVNWLKATLLCFPQVRRMVPSDFHLNDPDDVKVFRDVEGLRGEPLLKEEPTNTGAVIAAQSRLLTALEPNVDYLLSRYSQERTLEEYGNTATFQMYRGKMVDLLEFLGELGLTWHEWEIRGESAEDWFGLHPKLGEAIMSAMAIAVARDKGLDIVTSSGSVHHALTSLDENAVMSTLLETYEPSPLLPSEERVVELTDELAEVVMTTFFDVGQLSAQQIAELTREGHSLQSFKNELVKIAGTIPDIQDPAERQKRLEAAAAEVMKNWEEYKKGLPKYALEAMISGAGEIKVPDLVLSGVGGAAAGIGTGVAASLIGGGAIGLAVAMLIYSGVKVWRTYKEKTESPYQFLSRVESAGASLRVPAQSR